MALTDYQPERRVVPLRGDATTEVSGISLNQFAELMRVHFDDLEAIVGVIESTIQGEIDLTESQFGSIVSSILRQFPQLVANLIALACDQEELELLKPEVRRVELERKVKHARMLSAPLQFELLRHIADLTFNEVGGVKKGLEIVTHLLKANGSEGNPLNSLKPTS